MANKQYNLNTSYGRKKARQQAQYNYDNGTPEYRQDIDRIKAWFWAVTIVIMIIVGSLIYLIGGAGALKSWLK